MCSLWVAILTAVLLQVKTFVLYPHHYDPKRAPRGSTDVFQGFDNKVLTLQICFYSGSWTYSHSCTVPTEAPNARVKYVAHRASCYPGSEMKTGFIFCQTTLVPI